MIGRGPPEDSDNQEDAAHQGPQQADATASRAKVRRRWTPEAGVETAHVLRLLALRPWLVAGRDDHAIATVKRNLTSVREAFSRLGWIIVVERDLVRLRKSPPVRREAWASSGPTPLQASWFFLLVAAAESMAPRVALAQLVSAAKSAAAEAGIPVINDITERRAIVRALKMLHERGVVEQAEGNIEGFEHDENAPVLLAVHHTRLVHVIANFGTADPTSDPFAWLEQVEREKDVARRMRRRLVDDALVHAADLDEAEADWLSRRVRGDDGAPLAAAFGLHLERRAEGAAFVVPEDAFKNYSELGPFPFPAVGTVHHAALLLCEHASNDGGRDIAESGRGPGWRSLSESTVLRFLSEQLAERAAKPSGWASEYLDAPATLAAVVSKLLTGLDLLRMECVGEDKTWWFSPATGRWDVPPEPIAVDQPTSNLQATGQGDRT